MYLSRRRIRDVALEYIAVGVELAYIGKKNPIPVYLDEKTS